MLDEFRTNVEDIESESPFSRATRNTIAEAQLIDHTDGKVELVTDRLGFSLLVGQFEAMEAKGFDTVMRNESYGPDQKSLIFSEKDADVVRRMYDQCRDFHRAYLEVLDQRGIKHPPSRKQPGQGM